MNSGAIIGLKLGILVALITLLALLDFIRSYHKPGLVSLRHLWSGPSNEDIALSTSRRVPDFALNLSDPKKLDQSPIDAQIQAHTSSQVDDFMANRDNVKKLVKFIQLYGKGGVVLRELLMLATTRYHPVETQPGFIQNDNSTQPSTQALNQDTFLCLFIKYVAQPGKLIAMRDELTSRGMITVSNQSTEDWSRCGDWVVDNQVWTAVKRDHHMSSTSQGWVVPEVDKMDFHADLLDVFDHSASRARPDHRRRLARLCYNHLSLGCIGALQELLTLTSAPVIARKTYKTYRERCVHVILDYMVHHRMEEDKDSFSDMARLLRDADLESEVYPCSHIMWKWATLNQELKSSDCNRDVDEPLVCGIITELRRSSIWSNHTVGLMLASMIRDTRELERDGNAGVLQKVLTFSHQWCEDTHYLITPEATRTRSIRLPWLNLWDQLEAMPQRHHLDCGLNASRRGNLKLAEHLLASGLLFVEPKSSREEFWRYHIELLTVTMRLGRWVEAERKLQSTLQRLEQRDGNNNVYFLDIWQLNGEYAEFRLAVACLLADCFARRRLLAQAESLLATSVDEVRDMRDDYIVSNRVAMRSRLLQAQLQQGKCLQAKETSILQCRDIFGSNHCFLRKGRIRWETEELLACINELIDVEMFH